MYTKSARFYDALYHLKNYSAASTQLHEMIQKRVPNARSLLDVGCGTGKHLEILQQWYRVAGADLNPELLEIARLRCPDVPFYQGDMANFTMDRTFDVVTCLFGAIAYVRHVKELRLAAESLARCVSPGGILVVEPWFSQETYWTERLTADFVDQPDLKIARMYVSRKEDSLAVLDIHYLVGSGQTVSSFTERHELGLFSQQEYTEALHQAGLDVSYDRAGLFGLGVYFGARQP